MHKKTEKLLDKLTKQENHMTDLLNQDRNLFRRVLAEEFVKRCKKNPSYSLRAYSQSLGVTVFFLSRILKEERSLSMDRAHKISDVLRLPEDMKKAFLASVHETLFGKHQ